RQAGPASDDPGLWCIAASACLYLGGIALNDYFDREVDAVERPERPIPSGTVPPIVAAGLGAALLAAGIAFAGRAGTPAIMVAAVLALAILVYDGVDRKSTRLNSSHVASSYAVFCLKKKKRNETHCSPT